MTDKSKTYILSLNGGSSSLKFSLYHSVSTKLEWAGSIDRIGEESARLEIKDISGKVLENRIGSYKDFSAAVAAVIEWIKNDEHHYPLLAIGHRLVQGGPNHRKPLIITNELLQSLDQLIYLAPNHLPDEIDTIKAFQTAYPDVQQIACFDTSFHRNMPAYATDYPLPAKFKNMGLIRYGFHGLSYEFIMQELAGLESPVAQQKIIIAHLGNGASMVAIKNGLSVDTTMGISPIGGLVMGTRSGDLDPGVSLFLLKQAKMTPDELDDLLSKQSGLIAIAGKRDVQELLKMEPDHPKAKKALTLFCYSARKFIGSLAAAMGGLDMLVFTGGIGENSAIIRERICKELGFIGIELDPKENRDNKPVISKVNSSVSVRVIPTNEELMIARLVCSVLELKVK
ncbi:acetate/propionate family kinase [Mucilaginibacter sp.]